MTAFALSVVERFRRGEISIEVGINLLLTVGYNESRARELLQTS